MISIIYALLLLPLNHKYELPNLNFCDTQSCDAVLNANGYLVNKEEKKIFKIPIEQTMFNSYTLFKSRNKFILESENTTSSRNWSIIIFSYSNNKVFAERYISLSRNISSPNENINPNVIHWIGKDCRGNLALDESKDPFDAVLALCGDNTTEDEITMPKTNSIKSASEKGLVVTIPVYDKSSSQAAIYFFPQSQEPNAASLLCMSNCGLEDSQLKHKKIIGQSLWIDMQLQENGTNKYAGTYFYINKKINIPVEGYMKNNYFKINEFNSTLSKISASDNPSATFDLMREGDSFIGKWTSISSKKTFDVLLARRIY